MTKRSRNYSWLVVSLIALATSCQLTSCTCTKESADLILTGAKIFTSDSRQPWAEAVAIRDGKFVYFGDESGAVKYKSKNTRSVNLKGRPVIPGMIDSHAHPGYVDIEHYGDISETSRETMPNYVRAKTANSRGG